MKLRGISDGAIKRIAGTMSKESEAYPGNLGFVEMLEFFKIASPEQEAEMDRMLDAGDYEGVWDLLREVTGHDLEELK